MSTLEHNVQEKKLLACNNKKLEHHHENVKCHFLVKTPGAT